MPEDSISNRFVSFPSQIKNRICLQNKADTTVVSEKYLIRFAMQKYLTEVIVLIPLLNTSLLVREDTAQ